MIGEQEQVLEDIVRSGDTERCLAFFADMPERERRKLAPLAGRLFRHRNIDPFNPCRRIAVMATASLTELKRFRDHVLPHRSSDDFDAECRVLGNRRPAWIESWCAWMLQSEFKQWHFVRRLVRDGICPPPETDAYVLGVIHGARDLGKDSSVLSGLRNDPGILDDLVWRLFAIDPISQVNLPYLGELTGETAGWSYALRELAKEGRIDRKRLLSESLTALQRDFSSYIAGWFSRFHEYMEPTIEERAAFTERYLDLLASPDPPNVSFALRALAAIHKSRRLDNTYFVARVEPALYAETKTPVMQALRILAEIANKDSGLADRTVELAVVGLEHTQSDVQTLAFDIIEQYGNRDDDALRESVAERAALLPPFLQARVEQHFPELKTVPKQAEADDLDELRKRAGVLPPDLGNRCGVTVALAEIDSLSGFLPALYDSDADGRMPHLEIRPGRQMLQSPIRRFLSPLVIFFQLRFQRRIPEPYPPSEDELRLKYVLHASDNPFLESFRRHIPQSDTARIAFGLVSHFNSEKYRYGYYRDLGKILKKPDRRLTGKDVLSLAHSLSVVSAAWSQSDIDRFIRFIEDGRLDDVGLGEEMHVLLAIGIVKPGRWAERLAVVAAETPLHAQVVRIALEHALAQTPDIRPRNIHALLELLFNLCFEAKETITNEECRVYLESFSGRSKAATMARQLLALEADDPLPHRRAAAIVALRGRLPRAERISAQT